MVIIHIALLLLNGISTFKPNEQANPFIGKENLLEYVEEIRLEVLCDISLVTQVLETIRKVHPYEEPGIDIIPLLDETSLTMEKNYLKKW